MIGRCQRSQDVGYLARDIHTAISKSSEIAQPAAQRAKKWILALTWARASRSSRRWRAESQCGRWEGTPQCWRAATDRSRDIQ
jgi:hypothetical protein